MRRSIIEVSLLAVALGVGGSACVDNGEDGGIFFVEAVAPQSGCVVMATIGEQGLSHGEMSSVLPTKYVITAQLQSRITAAIGQESGRIVSLTDANIDLTFPDSTLFTAAELGAMKTQGITHFKSLFSAPLEPNSSLTDASFSITPLALYDSIYAKAPQAREVGSRLDPASQFELEVLATITVNGTMGGNSVKSQAFQFPISISNINGVVAVAGTCPLPMGSMVSTGNACGEPQDAAVTCCTGPNGLICPATVAATAP